MLTDGSRQQFEDLHAAGMAAKDVGDHSQALNIFESADQLAVDYSDDRKRLDALQPAARALGALGRYDEAQSKLGVAAGIAGELGLRDEQGIIISNIGRIAASQIVRETAAQDVPQQLQQKAVPKFKEAFGILRHHPHLYFRYANAQHGSVAAALAGERKLSAQLLKEGMSVAFRKSPEPYDQKRTYEINKRGLIDFLAAAALVPFGNRTPGLARVARTKLVR